MVLGLLFSLQHPTDNTPDAERVGVGDFYGRILRIARNEEYFSIALHDALEGKFAIKHAHGNVALGGKKRTVNDKHVALVNAFVDHGIADDFDDEGRGGMVHEFLVEVNGLAHVGVLYWRRKAGMDHGFVEEHDV